MRILNAISEDGLFRGRTASLAAPEWQGTNRQHCAHPSDQDLFACLEEANWGDGQVYASAKWKWREVDEPEKGPQYTAGTWAISGSGIHFYYLTGNKLMDSSLHFMCEVPWAEIFHKESGEPRFVGPAEFRENYLRQIKNAQATSINASKRLQDDLRKEIERSGHLLIAQD